ncbi:MAG: Hsp70 family protein [Candidatus Scalindua sp.]
MTNKSFIGIDLGTTFSAIAHINEHGVPEIIENSEGERTTPSVVLFDGEEVSVGTYAKDNMVVYPGQGVEFVKSYMGDDLYCFEYNGKKYNASEISSLILEKLKNDAEKRLGIKINDVVITVPAYFGDPQRRATIEAGKMAGLNVVQVINEPTAAAYSYGLHKLGERQRVLVFDLGGGTFDVTVIEIGNGRIEVKATNGDYQLGGKDWDEALIQYIAERFESMHGISPFEDEGDYQALKEKALSAKISLSNLPKVNIIYGCKGKTIKEEITREKFEEITTRQVEQCQMLTELVLEEAKYESTNIDVVLLAGGSTRMPMVTNMLNDYFGKEPSKSLNPDECVALGAAVKAALLKKETWALPGEKKTWALPSKMQDINVTSHSFGLVAFKEDGEVYNKIIIPKNTPYPKDESKSDLTTTYDNQTILDIYVLEGEAEDPRDCDLVGSYQFYDIPKRPSGKTRFKVTYRYNENQIVEVTAVDLTDNKELPFKEIENADLDHLSTSTETDVALLIDCSSSMFGSEIEDAKKAAISFVGNFKIQNGRVGLITFPGGVAHTLCNNFSTIESKIKALIASGSTPMTEALDIAHSQMLIQGGCENVIVLLSDGAPDNSSSAEASAAIAKKNGIRIITIGVSGADEQFLKKITSSPDDYYFCNQSVELESTFINIATQLTGSGLKKI